MLGKHRERAVSAPAIGRHDMWARFNHWQAPRDDLDNAIAEAQRYGEEIVPEKRQEPGFRGMYSFVDRDAGKGVTVTLWDSEADLQASAAAAEKQRGAGIARTGGEIADVEHYEVVQFDLV
jgi:heme-degrading monooxygenase HmoA